MSTVRATFRSAVWNHAGKVLEYVLMYVVSILIARGLGVQENGRFVGLFSVALLIVVLSSFGLETSLNRFIPQLAELNRKERTRFILRRVLLVRVASLAIAAVAFLGFLLLVTTSLNTEKPSLLVLVFLFAVARSLFPLFAVVLTAQLCTDVTSRINLAIRIIELILVLLLGRFTFSVENLFALFFVTSTLHVAMYGYFSRSNVLGATEPVQLNPILTFGGIFWANTVVDFFLGRQGDILFLRNLIPDSTQAGLYDAAYSVAQLASLAMTTGLSGVTLATFARLSANNRPTMDRFYSFSVRIVSLLTVPITAFMLFSAGPIVSTLYSGEYSQAATLVQGIMGFRIVSRLFAGGENAEYLLAEGRVATVVLIGLCAATINIGLNILLIPEFLATGTVFASGLGVLAANVIGAFMVIRFSTARIQLVFWTKLVAASLICAYATTAIDLDNTIVMLAARSIVFAALMGMVLALTKPFHREDLDWIKSIHARAGLLFSPFVKRAEASP